MRLDHLLSKEQNQSTHTVLFIYMDIENFTVDYISGQASKGIGWMPWYQEPKKDGVSAETPRGAANRH